MIPPPPQGYNLVSNKEIPIVPFGAMFYSSEWMLSFKVGGKPCDDFQYAIPAPTTEPESQDELVATQRRVIEILESNLEKSESRFQALQQESDQMLDVIAQQLEDIEAHVEQIAEIRATLKRLTYFPT